MNDSNNNERPDPVPLETKPISGDGGKPGRAALPPPPTPPPSPPPSPQQSQPRPVPTPGPTVGLAANLERTGRHPVLIFGSSASGKSSFLMSLVQSLRMTRDVDVALGERVLDRADPRSETAHRQARDFFERGPYTTRAGRKIDATQGEPFFLPLDIRPTNNRLAPVKFAFLDSRGEGYLPNLDPQDRLYKELHPLVIDVLKNFSHGVTIIYIAPYSVSDGHDRDTLDSDFGLLGAIAAYRELRRYRINDFHLYLLSKWDQLASPMDAEPLFDQLTAQEVDEVLRDRYAQSWGDFQGLPLDGVAGDRRAFMQYSAGHFVDGNPSQPPPKFAPSFDRYPRTILSWLYGNATQFRLDGESSSISIRQRLFNDVEAPAPADRSFIDRLAALLTSN